MAQRPRLFLHVGSHKTGTTTIQHSLQANRPWLAEQGIHYFPDYTEGRLRNNNHELARMLAEGLTPAITASIEERLRPDVVNLVSTESFYRNVAGHDDWVGPLLPDAWKRRQLFLADTARIFEAYDITVLLWIRRADEYAEAVYGTIVRGGNTKLTFEEFINSKSILFDYAKHVACLREYFKDVRVFAYGRSGMLDRFYKEIGLPIPPVEVERANTSPDPRMDCWMVNWLRRRDLNKVEVQMRKRFIFAPEQKDLFDDSKSITHWRDEKARLEFTENFEVGFHRGFFPDERKPERRPVILSRQEQKRIDARFGQWEEKNEHIRRRLSKGYKIEYKPRGKSFSFQRLIAGLSR